MAMSAGAAAAAAAAPVLENVDEGNAEKTVPPFLNELELQATAFASNASVVLNTEEIMAARISLLNLNTEQRLRSLTFFGKVNVTSERNRDYYLAYALPETSRAPTIVNALDKLIVYYTQDLRTWAIVQTANAGELAACAGIRQRFAGDPAFTLTVPSKPRVSAATSTSAPPSGPPKVSSKGGSVYVRVTESKRLYALVRNVLGEVGVAPKGVFYRDAMHMVQRNYSFRGIRPAEANLLSTYALIGQTKLNSAQTHQPEFEDCVSIFDTLETFKPSGAWKLRVRGVDVYLSSLVWPGYHMYASTLHGAYTCAYYGDGRKELDLGFML